MSRVRLTTSKLPVTLANPCVDPLAIPSARNLLTWLRGLPSRTNNKVISGQRHKSIVDTIISQTGIRVGLLSVSLFDPSSYSGTGGWTSSWGGATTRRQALVEHWQAGGIVADDMFPPNPKTKGGIGDNNFSNADMVSARTDGNAINTNFKEWLDTWCSHALILQDAGISIIIRPLHERNGGGFWWADKTDLPEFHRYVFNYITQTKGIHNCIWNYNVGHWGNNNGPPSDPQQYMVFYPGDAYCDIMTFDRYENLTSASMVSSDFNPFDFFAGHDKPMGLGEFGPDVAVESQTDGQPADMRKLIDGIRTHAPQTIYWESWSGPWSMDGSQNSHIADLLNDPWVINAADVPTL